MALRVAGESRRPEEEEEDREEPAGRGRAMQEEEEEQEEDAGANCCWPSTPIGGRSSRRCLMLGKRAKLS